MAIEPDSILQYGCATLRTIARLNAHPRELEHRQAPLAAHARMPNAYGCLPFEPVRRRTRARFWLQPADGSLIHRLHNLFIDFGHF